MKKSLLIFDLDGTLIDSVPDIATAVAAMLGKLGVTLDDLDRVRNWVGNGSLNLTARALAWAKLPCDEESLHHAHQLFLVSYQTCAFDKTVAYDGVIAGLDDLHKAGFTLAIATNKPARFVPEILAGLGIGDKFALVLGGDSLPVKKPDPAPLLHICETLGFDKTQAIMIGDSKNDVQAGQNAGITTLALTYGYNYDEPIVHSNPDAVFDGFAELSQFILQKFA
jgi:phosphoglycolate phosphatase